MFSNLLLHYRSIVLNKYLYTFWINVQLICSDNRNIDIFKRISSCQEVESSSSGHHQSRCYIKRRIIVWPFLLSAFDVAQFTKKISRSFSNSRFEIESIVRNILNKSWDGEIKSAAEPEELVPRYFTLQK